MIRPIVITLMLLATFGFASASIYYVNDTVSIRLGLEAVLIIVLSIPFSAVLE